MKREKITHQRRQIRLRIEILDELLGSIKRRTYPELLEELNRILEENGEVGIEERTLKYDIAHLEKKQMAPLHRPTKNDPLVYYTEKFSLKNVPVDDEDITILKDAVSILRKATNIKLTDELDEIISRLENKIHTNVPESNTMIAFEEHTEAKGKQYIDELFPAIKLKQPIKVTYQPFGKSEREWLLHPYMLKEYRNRWYLICRVGNNESISHLALDRIKGNIRNTREVFLDNNLFDPETYFNNLIGVTIHNDQKTPMQIEIQVTSEAADYIKTKPIHKSQKIIKELKNGKLRIQLQLLNNYELKSTLLSYGASIEVISPKSLRLEIKEILKNMISLYK